MMVTSLGFLFTIYISGQMLEKLENWQHQSTDTKKGPNISLLSIYPKYKESIAWLKKKKKKPVDNNCFTQAKYQRENYVPISASKSQPETLYFYPCQSWWVLQSLDRVSEKGKWEVGTAHCSWCYRSSREPGFTLLMDDKWDAPLPNQWGDVKRRPSEE